MFGKGWRREGGKVKIEVKIKILNSNSNCNHHNDTHLEHVLPDIERVSDSSKFVVYVDLRTVAQAVVGCQNLESLAIFRPETLRGDRHVNNCRGREYIKLSSNVPNLHTKYVTLKYVAYLASHRL